MLVQGNNFLANNRLPKHSYLAQVEYHILIFCLRRADDTCLSFKVSRECWAYTGSYRNTALATACAYALPGP